MARITLKPINNTLNAVKSVNENMLAIADVINEKAVLRYVGVGGTSNIYTDIDTNNQKIRGLVDGTTSQALATVKQLADVLAGAGAYIVTRETQTGGSATTLFTTVTYEVGSGSLSVYKNGLRMVGGVDYTETLSNQIDWTATPAGGDNLDFYVSEVVI